MALVLGSAATAATQPGARPCLQPREAEDLAIFILPSLIEGMARKCQVMLPAGATLARSGAAIAGRYRAESNAAWPNAKIAFGRLSGENSLNFLSEEVLRVVIEEATSAAIVADFKPKDCTMANRFVDILEPLPARNMGQLVALLLESGAGKDKSDMRICTAVTR
jgi:hypothetical protein